MTMTNDSSDVSKLLTYVFEDDAPLPEVERLDLTDGLYLSPISPFLLQADDDYHIMAVVPRFSQFFRDHLHESTLNVAFCGRKDLNYEGVKSEEEVAKLKVDHYLLSAMIFSPTFLAPYASFVTIPDDKRICHSSRMMDFGHLGSEQQPLTDAGFAEINQLYGPIKDVLSDGKTGRLPTALRYYQQAFRSDIDWSVRFLGMMEALFSHGASEISHQVSERAAFFLKQSPSDRENLYSEMRSHYSLRSKIAHGGTPNESHEKLERAFGNLLKILRDAVAQIIKQQEVFSLFESGNSEEFNKAMRSLVFRGTVTLAE